ncbi:NfeD family protein [Thermosediminibacter litoriperuensis]|uniref:Membrane-bound serine protease (ClpP class) n=1 Tax=Thermosediminibacter litoriperuensis TaxID=291989 RepID=A0A5S5AVP8_9FIRM|nr:nodulation protein NfeD [Thermosediminibacter litoriperuensis]TYP55500.1 membrane-bound serine protease (ClpP class) [Thermosediminibacter litoriperuensis]
MRSGVRTLFIFAITVLFLFSLFTNASGLPNEKGEVVFVPVKGMVDPGMAKFVKRAVEEAREEQASLLVLEIDTPGGRVDTAVEISQTILNSPVPTAAYVNSQATSAGVLIAVSCEKLYMAPGSTIGAAETIPKEEKAISYWRSKLEGAAERRGRDPRIVAAMADADVEIEGLKEKGKILSLTAQKALELKLADGIAADRKELLAAIGVGDREIKEVKPYFLERVASFVTGPFVAPMLLTIGFIGIITEVLAPGFGVPGFIGITSLVLFFAGHMIAELAGWESVILFLAGVILLAVEALMPGFGVFGLLGITGIITGIVTASATVRQGLITVTISMVSSMVILAFLVRRLARSPFFDRLVLFSRLDKSSGYSATEEKPELLGRTGVTLTPLRPAGIADFGGTKHDVVSDGEFIESGQRVRVVKVEGARIVVERVD